MKIEQAIQEMRHGKVIYNSLFPDDKFRIEYGYLEIINKDFPDGCHTSLNGDYITSDCWEVVEPEDPNKRGIHSGDKIYIIEWEDIYSDDNVGCAISLPKTITEKECKKVELGYSGYKVECTDETSYYIDEVYKTIYDAQKYFDEWKKKLWKDYHCDEMIEKLLKLKETMK